MRSILFIIIAIVIFCVYSKPNVNNQKPATTKQAEITYSPPDPRYLTYLGSFEWKKGGFDNVALIDFKITNNNPVTVKDIEVECDFYAKSGTKLDTNSSTIYDIIEPGKTKLFTDFNIGLINRQANGMDCRIKGVKNY